MALSCVSQGQWVESVYATSIRDLLSGIPAVITRGVLYQHSCISLALRYFGIILCSNKSYRDNSRTCGFQETFINDIGPHLVTGQSGKKKNPARLSFVEGG